MYYGPLFMDVFIDYKHLKKYANEGNEFQTRRYVPYFLGALKADIWFFGALPLWCLIFADYLLLPDFLKFDRRFFIFLLIANTLLTILITYLVAKSLTLYLEPRMLKKWLAVCEQNKK